MNPAPTPPSETATRQRLLEAAGLVFAECGYRAATVRDICQRAEANGAAINYHFGDKEKLYRAVLEHALHAAIERFPPDLDLPSRPTVEQRLHAFVRSTLLRLLSDGVPAWLGAIMAREMIEPSGALDHLVEHVHKPLFAHLRAIVADVLGPEADPRTVLLCSQSVIAQCLFYRHCQAVISRMQHELPAGAADIDELAAHITRFSLDALRAAARARKRSAS